MEIILSNLCDSLTGSLSKKHGYSIRRTQDGKFVGQRKSKGKVPPDGHWRFIESCAQLSQSKLFVSDVRVSGRELIEAAREAGLSLGDISETKMYNASEVLEIKERMSL